MKELLEKWAVLAPNECEVVRPRDVAADYWLAVGGERFRLVVRDSENWSTNVNMAAFQAAVQEAIDARRQCWTLDSQAYAGAGVALHYNATVGRRILNPDGTFHFGLHSAQADSPAEALLAAYLKVLAADLLGERE